MNPRTGLITALAFALSANQSQGSIDFAYEFAPKTCTTAQPVKPLKPHAFQRKLSRRQRKAARA